MQPSTPCGASGSATAEGDNAALAVPSRGEYGIPEGLQFGFPVRSNGDSWEVIEGFEHDDFAKEKIKITTDELVDEREAVKELLPSMTATTSSVLPVLSVIVWVGGGVMLQVLMARAQKTGPEAVRYVQRRREWTSTRDIHAGVVRRARLRHLADRSPAGTTSATCGSTLGIVGFAASALIGMAILGPTSKKMKALAAERGPNDPVVVHMSRRIELAGRFDLVILILVVLDMVVKPGL